MKHLNGINSKKYWVIAIIIIAICFTVFSQETGNWEILSPMPTARQEMPSALLNGKIYISGGLTSWTGEGLNMVEVYDPETDSWSIVSPMPVGLHHHTLTAVNGKLYVVGGYTEGVVSNPLPSDRVFEYDPILDNWKEKASLYFPISEHAAVEYNGLLYVFGGRTNDKVNQPYTLAFDPIIDYWDDKYNPIPTPRNHLTAVTIDTLIVAIGGRISATGDDLFTNLDAFEIFSPSTNEWFSPTSLPVPRGALISATLNEKIYVMGGEYPGIYGNNYEYDISSNTWREVAFMQTPRHSTGAVAYDNKIYVIGGGNAYGVSPSNVTEVFTINLTNVEEHINPSFYNLQQNFPNPFNPSTIIEYSISEPSDVKLSIIDVIGREVVTLINKYQTAGEYKIKFDAVNLSSGTYLYTLNVNGKMEIKKMLLIK